MPPYMVLRDMGAKDAEEISAWTERSPEPRPLRVPVREPEIAELRAFCAAVNLGTIAAAAKLLGVSQPALSKRLRILEVVVGTQLLNRSTRGVTVTEDGARLYGAAMRVLDGADTVSALIQDRSCGAAVRIAVSPTIAEVRLPPVLAELAQLEPGLAVELVVANSRLVREMVGSGSAPVGIAAVDQYSPPVRRLNERVIWRDEIVVAVPSGHRWEARTQDVSQAEFTAEPMVHPDPASSASTTIAAALARNDLQSAAPVAALGSTSAMLETARALGVPALASSLSLAAQPSGGFTICRVDGIRFDREFALVWIGSTHEMEPSVQAVANHLLDLPFTRSRRRAREASQAFGIGSPPPV